MRGRAAVVAFFVGAGLLYLGLAMPARRAAAKASAELAQVQAEGEPLRARVERRERRRAAEERLRHALQVAPPRGEAAVTALRRSLLESLKGAPVSGVRLSVTLAASPLAARAHVAAEGSFADLVSLSERLLGREGGLVPERLTWSPSGQFLALELDGATLSGRP